MKNLIILCCLIAVTSAQRNWQRPSPPRQDIIVTRLPNGRTVCRIRCNSVNVLNCPPIDCPLPDQPVLNPQCPALQCNSDNWHFLFPTPDPNFYWQCQRTGINGFEALLRPCGCMTQFDYDLQRCVHPHEFRRQCNATPNPVPLPIDCPVECPGCGDNGPGLPLPTQPAPTNPPDNGCPCMPCVWWPCSPCRC